MELIEDLFKLWWELFLSLSTFSKVFIIVVAGLVILGAIEREKKKKQEKELREAKLKTLQKEEKEKSEKEEEEEI